MLFQRLWKADKRNINFNSCTCHNIRKKEKGCSVGRKWWCHSLQELLLVKPVCTPVCTPALSDCLCVTGCEGVPVLIVSYQGHRAAVPWVQAITEPCITSQLWTLERWRGAERVRKGDKTETSVLFVVPSVIDALCMCCCHFVF